MCNVEYIDHGGSKICIFSFPQGDRKGPHRTQPHARPYNDDGNVPNVSCLCKGGGSVERGGDPCGRPGVGWKMICTSVHMGFDDTSRRSPLCL